jgi:ParB family transcriptional regulator, chromosome partitioning protein
MAQSDDMPNAAGSGEFVRISPLGAQTTQKAKRPGGLGRGLSALLGDIQADDPVAPSGNGARARDGLAMVPITDIRPHPDQPRRHFEESALAELAESIASRGVVQPILVRPSPDGNGFQLVAGERRWRASQRAGLHHIPAIVRDLDDVETFTIALVENIQRQDLTAIEEAEAYARLRDQLGYGQDAIGQMTGKSRSHIANILRLLDLPESVRALVATSQLGMGHARALIGFADAESLAQKIVAKGLSVRKVEAMVRAERRGRVRTSANGSRSSALPDADIAALETHLADMLGVTVKISHSAEHSGAVTLEYGSLDQLDMLCQRLTGEQF